MVTFKLGDDIFKLLYLLRFAGHDPAFDQYAFTMRDLEEANISICMFENVEDVEKTLFKLVQQGAVDGDSGYFAIGFSDFRIEGKLGDTRALAAPLEDTPEWLGAPLDVVEDRVDAAIEEEYENNKELRDRLVLEGVRDFVHWFFCTTRATPSAWNLSMGVNTLAAIDIGDLL